MDTDAPAQKCMTQVVEFINSMVRVGAENAIDIETLAVAHPGQCLKAQQNQIRKVQQIESGKLMKGGNSWKTGRHQYGCG